jgi:hypothetical protein
VLSCNYASERKLGEYFFSPTLSNRVFKEYSEHFEGVSNVFRIPEFQSVSKGFPKGFKTFQKSFKAFQKGFQRVSKRFKRVSKGFQKGVKAFPKGVPRV